jgi:hypothetical protein
MAGFMSPSLTIRVRSDGHTTTRAKKEVLGGLALLVISNPLVRRTLPPLSGDEKECAGWRGWTLRLTCQTGSSEVTKNSGFAAVSILVVMLVQEVFSQGLHSLPDAVPGKALISLGIRRERGRRYCKLGAAEV